METINAIGQIERTEKNLAGQVVRRINNKAAGASAVDYGKVEYRYDAFGSLTKSTVFNGSDSTSTSVTYDVRGRKSSMTDPDTGTWVYAYNAAGEMIWQEDAKEAVTTFTYDALGRMTTQTDVDGTTSWVYDVAANGKGRLATITTSAATEAYGYDSCGRPAGVVRTIAGQSFSTGQTYDSSGRPEKTVYPTGFQTKNHYNGFGFLKEVRRADSGRNDLYWMADSYALDGRVNGERLGNGLSVDRNFSEMTGRLKLIHAGVGADARAQWLRYTYDGLGNVLTRSDGAMTRDESFEYDGLNRITKHAVAGQSPVEVSYDGYGNITNKSDVGAYVYDLDQVHAVKTAGAKTFQYDANGNMTGGDGRTLSWTARNRVAQVSGANGASSSFVYGGRGERVRQVNHLGQTIYYVGATYEKRVQGAAEQHWHYIFSPAGRIGVRVESTSAPARHEWFHADGLGSINAVTDDYGRVIQRFAYDAWGKRVNPGTGATIGSATNSGVNRGFTDHEHLDDLGLIHMNGRVYDPVLGRFLSADVLVQDIGDTQTFNRYSYCGNNPLSRIDPSGFSFWDSLMDSFSQVVDEIKSSIVRTSGAIQQMGGAISGSLSGFAGSLINGDALGGAFRSEVSGVSPASSASRTTGDPNVQPPLEVWAKRMSDASAKELDEASAISNEAHRERTAPNRGSSATERSTTLFGIPFMTGSPADKIANGDILGGLDQWAERLIILDTVMSAVLRKPSLQLGVRPRISSIPEVNVRPPSMSPPGAGRTGALREALRVNGVPTSQQPSRVLQNVDLRGNPQPGRIYEYDVPAPGGGTRTVRIRDDAGGHDYGPNDPQNRDSHFNDESNNHYDYEP